MSDVSTETLLAAFPLDRNSDMFAVASAIAPELASLFEDCRLLTIYPRIAELDEATLDRIAADYSVAWYDYNGDLERKRQQIQDLFAVHRIAGTKRGTIAALSAYCIGFAIQEWYYYNGDPGTFRYTAALKPGVSSGRFIELLQLNKRVSAEETEYTAPLQPITDQAEADFAILQR